MSPFYCFYDLGECRGEKMRNLISESVAVTFPIIGVMTVLYWPSSFRNFLAVVVSGMVCFLLYGLYIWIMDKFLEI